MSYKLFIIALSFLHIFFPSENTEFEDQILILKNGGYNNIFTENGISYVTHRVIETPDTFTVDSLISFFMALPFYLPFYTDDLPVNHFELRYFDSENYQRSPEEQECLEEEFKKILMDREFENISIVEFTWDNQGEKFKSFALVDLNADGILWDYFISPILIYEETVIVIYSTE